MTEERQLVYNWLELPFHRQVEIAGKLNLLRPNDKELEPNVEFAGMVYMRVKTNNLYNKFKELVNAEVQAL